MRDHDLTFDVLTNPSTHFLTKEIINMALEKDIVDACEDIRLALKVMEWERDKFIRANQQISQIGQIPISFEQAR